MSHFAVLGTVASDPYAGMAWMHMQIVVGLQRLGHDVYYLETTSRWPYNPDRESMVCNADYAIPYLQKVAAGFGIADRWAYRRSYSDKAWLGPVASRAQSILTEADAVFNVAGATRLAEEGLDVGRLIYLGTDPVYHEVALANGDCAVRMLIDEHHDVVTYGENIGRPSCPIPPLPRLRARTRQPILIDQWETSKQPRSALTTVCNWRQDNHDIVLGGEAYLWSKHHEFLKVMDLPENTDRRIELAMGLQVSDSLRCGSEGESIPAVGMTRRERDMLDEHGWTLVNAHNFTRDPWSYREYIQTSYGEFTVARDQNVRLRSGWFSERSACYLAAGRPVVTQDTGFGCTLPVGEGLFAFTTTDDARAAIEAISADYGRHSRAAREIAAEYFRAEKVLSALLNDLGL